MISVPMVSEPSASSREPITSTAAVEITPISSIAGKNTENSFWA